MGIMSYNLPYYSSVVVGNPIRISSGDIVLNFNDASWYFIYDLDNPKDSDIAWDNEDISFSDLKDRVASYNGCLHPLNSVGYNVWQL